MAIEQKDKVRPVLNMSYPEGSSFNDNLDVDVLPKVKMSSARQFGQSVLRAGKGALMSKMDMRDAYKHVPAKVEDFRLQGMQWLGAYFVDTQQIFGQASAVPNFDGFAETTLDVTLAECKIPKDLVHRILDDVANVVPAGSEWGQEFVQKYKENCEDFNIRLASDCPLKEKAFKHSTRGTVMGIQFDTMRLAGMENCGHKSRGNSKGYTRVNPWGPHRPEAARDSCGQTQQFRADVSFPKSF